MPNQAQERFDAATAKAAIKENAGEEATHTPPKPPAAERSNDREVLRPESQVPLPDAAADVNQPVGSFEELERLQAKFPNAAFGVSVKASVNHWDRFQKKLFLQQDQHARPVAVPDSFHQSALSLRLGSQVRVIGEFDCSENRLVGEEIRKLKAGPISKAFETDLSAKRLGEHWGRRVACEGRVEAVLFEKKRCQLLLQQGQRRYLARFEQSLAKRKTLDLIGSRVRFTGTLDYILGTLGNPIAPIVHAVFEDDFEIVEPTKSELRTWTHMGLAEENTGLTPGRLAELRGQVTFLRKHDQLVIEDAEGQSTSVYSCFLNDVDIGDEVCVYALPVQPADARKPRLTPRSDRLGIGSKWRALVIERITPGFLDNMNLSPEEIVSQQLFLRRATVRANLDSVRSDQMNHFLRLSEDNHQFVARVHATEGQFNALRLTNDSRLAVTGLVEERLDNGESGEFQLRVASLEDISVLKLGEDSGDPLFWVVVGVLLSLVLVGTGLVWKLRGQVGEQSEDMALLIARLNATYDAVREGLLAVDERGRVLTVNPQFRELVGVELAPGREDTDPSWIVHQIA
ncbi:MAG: PAS domain-containing protein, partial [Planctomycetota bacterium]